MAAATTADVDGMVLATKRGMSFPPCGIARSNDCDNVAGHDDGHQRLERRVRQLAGAPGSEQGQNRRGDACRCRYVDRCTGVGLERGSHQLNVREGPCREG
jgi:hypothetical protein